jgi:excisionase family DNA binding protein
MTTALAPAKSRLADAVEPALLDVHAVARLLGCSWRTVYRMSDAGRMPRPVKLGALVRFRRSDLDQWLSDGCPATRRGA